jgi:AbrB family looped-hinge helix DNA binding protein
VVLLSNTLLGALMTIATSRLTRKYQATIPAEIRTALKLRAGDDIAFELERGKVRLRKARARDRVWERAIEATLTEWSGEADERAYRDL